MIQAEQAVLVVAVVQAAVLLVPLLLRDKVTLAVLVTVHHLTIQVVAVVLVALEVAQMLVVQ